MIKLGKLTDYAVALMGQLAREAPQSIHSAHDLSVKTGIPEPTVAKLLKILAKAELVSSTRGAAGGYGLARPAGQITVAQIITAIDGPIAIVTCVDGHQEDCSMWEKCPTRGSWDRVNDAIRHALASVTLADMLVNSCSKAKALVQEMNVSRT